MAQDIFERLKEDHERHRQLINQIKETTGASDERKALFEQFKTDAMAHAAAEEGTLYVAMMEDPEIRQGIKEYANWPTIPQLYVNGEFVGGCDILREMYQSGELKQVLDAQPSR